MDVRSVEVPSLRRLLRRQAVRSVSGLTVETTGPIERVDERTMGYALARSGVWGPVPQREIEASQVREPLTAGLGCLMGALADYGDREAYPQPAPLPGPAALSRHIKAAARFLKADLVGVCELPQWAVFSRDWARDEIVCDHRFAIVLASDWDYDTTDASTGDDWICLAEEDLAYNQSALIACSLAAYIRELGYPARAHYQGNFLPPCYDVVMTPLVLLAGLGEFSRAGWALNPQFSGRFKVSVVTTDLPLLPDRPVDFGLQAFCRACKRCAHECPSRAISDASDPALKNGYLA